MRLLFVEDEPDLREVLKKQLQGSGYSVDACGDGGISICSAGGEHPSGKGGIVAAAVFCM